MPGRAPSEAPTGGRRRTRSSSGSTRRARAPGRIAARSPRSSACPTGPSGSPRSRPAAPSGARRTSTSRPTTALLALRTERPVLLALTRRESLRFHVKRHPFWMTYTVACDETGRLARRPGPDRRRQRGLRQRRRQGPRAGRRPRLRGLPRAERRRRGAGRLHEQPAVRGDARLRGQPGRLRPRGDARHPGRPGRDRRLGDPLAQCARGGRPVRHRAAPGSGCRAQADAPRGPRRLPIRPLRGDRLRGEEHRHRQRSARVREGDPPTRDRRDRDPLSLLDRDGPGRSYRIPADRLHRARPAA